MKVDRYLADAGLMDTTRSTYRRDLMAFRDWLEREGLSPRSFNGQDFDRYVSQEHPNWSPGTQRACLFALKGWALWAHGEDHPIRRKRIHVPAPDDPRVLSRDEVCTLLEAVDRTTDFGRRNFAIVRLMLDCGIRASEVGRIQVAKVDLGEGRLAVLQKQGRMHRPVFGEAAGEAIGDWMAVRPKYTDNGTLFVSMAGSTPGEPITRSGVYNIYRSLSVESGIKVGPHVIRYTFVDHALRRGVPMKVIAAQGGWESIHTVERYARGLDAEAFRVFLPEYI